MKIRPYMDHDWQSVLDICILAFTPIHQSFETLLGTDLFRLVYPDWKASHERYLRSLTNAEKDRLFVAEENGSAVGFIHYEVSPDAQSGKIGLNAVYIPHQHTWQLEHEPVIAGSGKLVILPAFRELRGHF